MRIVTMNPVRTLVVTLVGLSSLAGGCTRDDPFGPLPGGLATVGVQAFLEYDGNPGFGGGDDPAPGLRFEVVLPGSSTAVATGVADATGQIVLEKIPIGTYDLRVDPAYLGDTLVVTQIDTTRVTLAPDMVFPIQVGVTPPTRSVSEARSLPEGRRVWITGMALNSRPSSVDGALHVLQEGDGAMRVVFPSAVPGAPGDSLRTLGSTVGSGSSRYLAGGWVAVLAQDVRPILPLQVSLDEARSAGGGAHDAKLVVVRTGVVSDTATVPFVGVHVTIADGPTTLTMLLRQQNGFGGAPPLGAPVNSVVGLLVPDPASPSTWRLVPRGQGDVSLGAPPPSPRAPGR